MNIKDLEIFLTAAKLGSINKTAKQLNYVQSNITSRINKLEKDLQTALFYRDKTGIILTDKGQSLLPLAQEIIALSETFIHQAQEKSSASGQLRIGTMETMAKLPVILSRFINLHPKTALNLSTNRQEILLDQVKKHRLDGAFIATNQPFTLAAMHHVDVFQETLVLITPPQTLSIEEAFFKPLLQTKEDCNHQQQFQNWLSVQSFRPEKNMTLGTLNTTIGAVSSGLGFSYAPYSAVEQTEKKGMIRCFYLPKTYSDFVIRFVYRKAHTLSPALLAFIQVIEEIKASYASKT